MYIWGVVYTSIRPYVYIYIYTYVRMKIFMDVGFGCFLFHFTFITLRMELSPGVWNWDTSLVIIGQTASVRLVVSYCWVVPQRCLLLGLISRTGRVLMGVLALVASRVSGSYVLDLCLALDHQLPASSLDYCWWCWHIFNGFPIDGRKLRLNGVKVYFLPRWEIHWQIALWQAPCATRKSA